MVCLLATNTASRDSLGAEVAVGWGTAMLIEIDNTGYARSPQVAVDESGNAIAVWVQHDGIRDSIYSNRYVVGTGWGSATLIETDDSGDADYPQVAVDGSGNAMAVWHQFDGARFSIWSNRYIVDTGWGTAELVETDDSGNAESPQVAVDDSGNAVVVWSQWGSTYSSIWSNRYVVGTGWGTAELIETDDVGDAYLPQVGIDGSGNAIAVWHQFDSTHSNIYSNRYVVGAGWDSAELIEIDDSGNAESPQVAVDDSGNAIAVWFQSDGTHTKIYSNRYVVGEGWDSAELIETDDVGDAYLPQVFIGSSGDAMAVWSQWDDTRSNIWSNRYVVGTGWDSAELIETDDVGGAYQPELAVDGSGNAVAVWYQYDGARFNICSNRYVVGAGWGTAELVETDDSGNALVPQVAVDGSGNATAVWYQWGSTSSNIWSNRYIVPDITPPSLSIDSPSDGHTTEIPVVKVLGTTEPGVDLEINGIMVAVGSDGSFSCIIALLEGVNTITATAIDASGNPATDSVSVTYVNPFHEFEDELEDTKDELVDVRDELDTTKDDLDAVIGELDATKDELNATQADLDAVEDELSTTQDDLASAEEELSNTSDDLNSVKSQNTLLMAVLAAFAILAIVMIVMFLSLRKKMAELSVRSVEEETPPPPRS